MWVNNKGKGWYTTCKGKDMNAKESVYFLSVQFKKGQEPNGDSANIEPKKWFMSSYFKNDGTASPKLVITEYEIEQKMESPYESIGNRMAKSLWNDDMEAKAKEQFGELVRVDNKPIDKDELPFF